MSKSWTRFTIQQANEIQRELMVRGVDEGTALSQAISEAGEQAKAKLWEDPLAQLQMKNTEENTRLHDGLLRAIGATEGLLG